MYKTFIMNRMKLIAGRPFILLSIILLPAILAVGMGLAVSSTAEKTKIPILFVDEDQSDYSQLVIKRASQNPALNIQSVDQKTAERMIKTSKADIAFVFLKGFKQKVMKNEEKGAIQMLISPASLSQGAVREIVAGEVMRLSANAHAANYVTDQYAFLKWVDEKQEKSLWKEAWNYTDEQWKPAPLMQIDYHEGTPHSSIKGAPSSQKYTIWLILFLSLMMLICFYMNDWAITEREDGVLQRMFLFSIKLRAYVGGNLIGIFLLLCPSSLLFALFLIWNVHMTALQAASFLLISGVYVFLCLLISSLIACFCQSKKTYFSIGLLAVLVTSIGTGLPSNPGGLFNIFPQKWALDGMRSILIGNEAGCIEPAAVCAAAGLALFFAAVKIIGGKYDRVKRGFKNVRKKESRRAYHAHH